LPSHAVAPVPEADRVAHDRTSTCEQPPRYGASAERFERCGRQRPFRPSEMTRTGDERTPRLTPRSAPRQYGIPCPRPCAPVIRNRFFLWAIWLGAGVSTPTITADRASGSLVAQDPRPGRIAGVMMVVRDHMGGDDGIARTRKQRGERACNTEADDGLYGGHDRLQTLSQQLRIAAADNGNKTCAPWRIRASLASPTTARRRRFSYRCDVSRSHSPYATRRELPAFRLRGCRRRHRPERGRFR